jgi:hypothetical protein
LLSRFSSRSLYFDNFAAGMHLIPAWLHPARSARVAQLAIGAVPLLLPRTRTQRDVADQLRLNGRALRLELSELAQLRMPAVLHWNLNHFVVLEGFKGGKTYLNDPAKGPTRVTLEELNSSYSGVVLTFSVDLDATFPIGTTHLPNVVVVTGPGSNCEASASEPTRRSSAVR